MIKRDRKEANMLVLYTQPGCGMCRTAHILLDSKKIPYEESQDLEKLQALGVKGTPALDIGNDQILTGKALLDYIKSL